MCVLATEPWHVLSLFVARRCFAVMLVDVLMLGTVHRAVRRRSACEPHAKTSGSGSVSQNRPQKNTSVFILISLFHLPTHGRGTDGGAQVKRQNPGFGGSGQPRAAGKPLQKVGAETPIFFEGFPGRPGPPRPPNPRFSPLIWAPPLRPPPCEGV